MSHRDGSNHKLNTLDKRWQSFRTWLKKNLIDCEACSIAVLNDVGRSVVADRNISENEVVVEVPDECVLMPHNCCIAEELEGAGLCNSPGNLQLECLGLVMAVMAEKQLGKKSRWHGYLRFLPDSFPGMPLFWSQRHLTLLEGTTVAQKMAGTQAVPGFGFHAEPPSEVRSLWVRHAVPFFAQHPQCGITDNQQGYVLYLWSTAVVCGYSFSLGDDRFQGLVPMWDMLNHVTGQVNVRLHHDERKGVLQMIATQDIPAGHQVVNSYGDLSNAELLRRYGFVEQHRNRRNCLEVPISLVLQAAAGVKGCSDGSTGMTEACNDVHKGDAHKGDAHKGDAHKGDAHKGDVHNGDAHNGDVHKGDAHNSEAHNGGSCTVNPQRLSCCEPTGELRDLFPSSTATTSATAVQQQLHPAYTPKIKKLKRDLKEEPCDAHPPRGGRGGGGMPFSAHHTRCGNHARKRKQQHSGCSAAAADTAHHGECVSQCPDGATERSPGASMAHRMCFLVTHKLLPDNGWFKVTDAEQVPPALVETIRLLTLSPQHFAAFTKRVASWRAPLAHPLDALPGQRDDSSLAVLQCLGALAEGIHVQFSRAAAVDEAAGLAAELGGHVQQCSGTGDGVVQEGGRVTTPVAQGGARVSEAGVTGGVHTVHSEVEQGEDVGDECSTAAVAVRQEEMDAAVCFKRRVGSLTAGEVRKLCKKAWKRVRR